MDGFTLDESEEIVGDEIERTGLWKNGSDVNRLVGNPVRRRFRMKDTDLYSIKFAGCERGGMSGIGTTILTSAKVAG